MTTLACKAGVQGDACDSPLVKAGGIACTLTCSRASANEPCPGEQEEVIIFHAGSLTNAFTPLERAFVCQTGMHVIDCQGGSLDLARALTAGGYAADIYAPADYLDIDLFFKPGGYADYTILFAEGKMVLTYATSSTGADTSPSLARSVLRTLFRTRWTTGAGRRPGGADRWFSIPDAARCRHPGRGICTSTRARTGIP
jgi:ABC-type molybdate transport system substrate-binding protein